MKHKYNIENLITQSLAARGLFYPGIFIPGLNKTTGVAQRDGYTSETQAPEQKMFTDKGSPLRREDYVLGTLYFMPVTINDTEIPNTVISLSQAKRIVKTEMPGRDGTVKEFVSLDDLQIDITSVIVGENNDYPEQGIEKICNLWRLNESVEIVSAITDMWMPAGAKVVFTDIAIEPVGEYENVQTITMSLLSDVNLELEIK